ncbi:MAG TPA: radical SAM protein [Stellaceae bacterium]|nr:radical SAM protein [Stellaceae bacterium]
MPSRRIALACLTPLPDTDELGSARMPSYGIRRVQAAVAADSGQPGHVVRLFDLGREDVAAYIEQILAFEPDLLGLSTYVWSTDCLVAVAREVKRRRPSCLIVFGGPSARTALFDLDYFRDPSGYLDAVVEGDGEIAFRDIARLAELTRPALASIPGLTLPAGGTWHRTPPALGPADLDLLPSPFQLDLMPDGAVAYLETFRGCPLSCRFCEWGTDRGRGIFSADYIAQEMRAFARLQAPAVFLLDAGLNLNIRAFRNLRQAAAETGFLKNTLFWAEIYPTAVRDEHLDFLREVGPAYLGVGLQSRDPEVLRLHQRPAESARFEEAVRRLVAVTNIELQIIFGLPGDTPDGFRRTLDYALSLPAAVRAYHCLVLPDALMTRGLPEWDIEFDPRSLAMTSCLGWSAEDIAAMRAELRQKARRAGGKAGNFWWSFPSQRPVTASAMPA